MSPRQTYLVASTILAILRSTFNAVGNSLFNRAINFTIKSSITDSLSGFRDYIIKRSMSPLFSESFDIEVEIMVQALARAYRILEVPISYSLRHKSSFTKLNPLDGAKIARTPFFILVNVNPLWLVLGLSIFCSRVSGYS